MTRLTQPRPYPAVAAAGFVIAVAAGCSGGSDAQPNPLPLRLAAGQTIYRENCGMCHDQGHKGAPRIGSAAAWQPRLSQPPETLVAHAVEGFAGNRGTMPPRGDNPDLTDAQVQVAVEFLTHRVNDLPAAP